MPDQCSEHFFLCSNHIPPDLSMNQKPMPTTANPYIRTCAGDKELQWRTRPTTVNRDKSVSYFPCAVDFVFVVGIVSKEPNWRTGPTTVNSDKSVSYFLCCFLVVHLLCLLLWGL